MIDVQNQEDIEPTKAANPKETIRWIRPDGFMEYHWPFKPMKLLPPRGYRGPAT